MGEVIQFIPKSALERARLIREAHAVRTVLAGALRLRLRGPGKNRIGGPLPM
jgi:hypothetical protein